MSNTIDIAAEIALYQATTQGEYKTEITHLCNRIYHNVDCGGAINPVGLMPEQADATWIAHAHNSFREWMDEIAKGREAQRELAEARAAICELAQRIDIYSQGTLGKQLRRIAEGGDA